MATVCSQTVLSCTHPDAPLTKRRDTPTGASLFNPSKMAKPSSENNTCQQSRKLLDPYVKFRCGGWCRVQGCLTFPVSTSSSNRLTVSIWLGFIVRFRKRLISASQSGSALLQTCWCRTGRSSMLPRPISRTHKRWCGLTQRFHTPHELPCLSTLCVCGGDLGCTPQPHMVAVEPVMAQFGACKQHTQYTATVPELWKTGGKGEGWGPQVASSK